MLYLAHTDSVSKRIVRRAVPRLIVDEEIYSETPDATRRPFGVILSLLYRQHRDEDSYWRNLISMVLFLTLDVLRAIGRSTGGIRHSKPQWTWERVLNYIEENYPFHIPRTTAAKDLKIHPSHLSRLFRDHGATFSSYLNLYRVDKAKEPLRSSPELTVSEVAARTGFTSKSYFFKLFREETGASPQKFRNSL